ncbi:membrane-associated protein, putative [Bodo saltans]|uniref:Membrane-associated protein, putative n=1 Tax=Bodo saltans TaxID=75058 RepID=A0A0S4J8N0_BODSA|nr:membrane-associated protein, putative [Bodo saltans]|eukprot:CUG86884.1 membrane-associated protein, putative [Bodo saltans]
MFFAMIRLFLMTLCGCSMFFAFVQAQGTLSSINGFTSPYVFGEFLSLPHAVTTFACAATGTDCLLSVQPAGQCAFNALTLPSYTVPDGSTATFNMTKANAVVGSLYELCLHPNVASTVCVGSSMYYILMPNVSSVANLPPLKAASGYQRPYIVAPFQQQGALPVARMSGFQLNVTIPALSPSIFPSAATVYFALLPSCDFNVTTAQYLSRNVTVSLPARAAPIRSATGSSYTVTFAYSHLFHLWNMVSRNIGTTAPYILGGVLEGRICANVAQYRVNSTSNLSMNTSASSTSFPFDLGVSVRLATNFRVNGARVYREEDTTSSGASGSTTTLRLVAGAGGGISTLLFDGIAISSPPTLASLSSAVAADQAAGIAVNLSASFDIRDSSYPCDRYTTADLSRMTPPSSNARFAYLFATGSWNVTTSLVSWTTLINRTFPGNSITTSSGIGGATGLLCLYVFNVPLLSLHVGGGVYSIAIEGPSSVLTMNNAYLSAAQGGSLATAATLSATSVLNNVDSDVSFNFSAIAPSISMLRFTASTGSCSGVSSQNTPFSIQTTSTRYLTAPSSSWFAGSGLRRLCVALVLNTSDTLPYYFQDLAIPTVFIVTAFSRIAETFVSGSLPDERFFIPLNAATYSLPLLGFIANNSPYSSGQISLTFSTTPAGCLGATMASSSITTLTAFGSGATFGIAAALTPQLSLLATRFPQGTFSSNDKATLCIGDTTTISYPSSPMPLLTSNVYASFYTIQIATQSVSAQASTLVMQGTGLPTIVLYVHPTLGLSIPVTLLVRTGTSSLLWTLASVLGVVRLSATGSTGCTSAQGALTPLSLVTQWSSVDASDVVRVTGAALEQNATRAAASTGVHYVCFHSLHASIFQEQDDVLYSRTSFPVGIVSFSSVNGLNVNNGPNTTIVGVIQYVSFVWVVTGSGFSSAGLIQMIVGGVIASTPLTVVNDTYALFTFSPQSAGTQSVNVTLGTTLSYLAYPLITIDVVGVAAVGRFGTTYTAMLAGSSSLHFINLTSTVSVLPSVCLASAVATSSQACTCIAGVNTTMTTTTSLWIDLTATNPSAVVGSFPICFQYNSVLHFATGYSVVVVPQLSSLGGTAASSGSDQSISFVRGTSPDLVATFDVNIPTAAQNLRLIMYDVDNTIDLGGSGVCSSLSHHSALTMNTSNVIVVDLSGGIGTTTSTAHVPLLMTSNNQTGGRRLCSTLVLASRFATLGEPVTSFILDFDLVVVLGTLTVNGIALNSGTNVTTPILAQANTTLVAALPSFVAASSFLQFGIASTSCADLPTNIANTTSNQTTAITNLTLSYPSGGGSVANITIPAGLRSATSDLLFCARWLETASYTFTGVFFSVLYLSAFDGQLIAVNSTSQRLSMTAGSAVMRNATRLITVEGERVNAACLRVVLLPSRADSCTETNHVVFQGSIAQTTQQFSVSSATSSDYVAMCMMVYRSCTTRTYPAMLMVDAPLSILAFESFDIDSTTLTNLNQQQSELMAIVDIPMTNTLYGLISYSLSNVATLPFIELLAQPSTDSSCLLSQTTYRFKLEEVLDGGGLTTLGIVSNIPTAPTVTTFTVCILRNVSATDQRYFSLGMTLLVSSLTVGGSTLGLGNSVSLTVNKAPELVVTGSNLNLMLLYLALTDTGSCSSAALSGTNGVGISRIPSIVVSCSSSKGSVTFTAATNQTSAPLAMCIAGVPSSSGKATALSLTFYPANLSVTVTQALSLTIVTEPSAVASSDGSLSTQPVLGVEGPDDQLIQNVPSGIIITASWVAVSPYVAVESICDLCKITTDGEAFMLSATTSASLFSNAKFGVQYVLNYTSDRADINSVVTTTVKRGLCPVTQFGSLYSTSCEDCLSSAYCTGDVDYTMRSSYWRANNKTNYIYDCSPPYGSSQCIGNTSTGTCTEGHNGPRCTICDPGYGKSVDVCVLCASFNEALVTVVFLALAYIVLVIFATFSSVNGMDDKRDTKHLPILIKLLATHLAMASTVGEFSTQFPDLLNNLFNGMRSTSRPSPQFAALDCSIHPTVYQSFLFLILIPAFTFFAVLAGSYVVRLIHYARDHAHEKEKSSVASLRDTVEKDRSARANALAEASRKYLMGNSSPDESPDGSPVRSRSEFVAAETTHQVDEDEEIHFATFDEIPVVTDEERELMHAEEDLAEYVRSQELRLDTKTLFLIALVVVLLFGYPTIVEQSLNLLKCDTIEYGEIQPDLSFASSSKSLYFYDRSLDCTSSDHRFYTLLAYASIVGYGLGIPFASVVMVLWFRKNRGVTYTNRLFVFLVCGYDEDRWWWEAVVLWRKLALASILVFIDDQRLQTYAALWLLMFALALQMWLEPYDEVNLDRLATASLAVVIVTLNLSLLYDYLPSDSSSYNIRVGNVVLTVCLFLINAVLISILVGLIVIHGLLEAQYQISMNAKTIRRMLPRSVQDCLFRFARRPLVTFHKILKKREREKERKNRIKHVINDADGELVDVVVMQGRRPSRTPGKSPALLSPSDPALQDIHLKSPPTIDLGNHNEKRSTKNLREALRREEVFVRDLLQKYELAIAELDSLRNRPDANRPPSESRNRQQLEAVKAEFDKIIHLASTSNPGSNLVSPADKPLFGSSTPPPPALVVHHPPELVVEDLTLVDVSVAFNQRPPALTGIYLAPIVATPPEEWSPSAPSAANDSSSRRSRLTTLQPSTGGRIIAKPKLKAEMASSNISGSEAEGDDIRSAFRGAGDEQPEEFMGFNDTQRASKYKPMSELGSTITAKNRKRMERALEEGNLLQ